MMRMLWIPAPAWLAAAALLLTPAPPVPARENAPVEVLSGLYEYNLSERTITLTADEGGLASVILGGQSIAAETIVFREAEEILDATGDVRLWDEGAILRGSRLHYRMAENAGSLWDVKQSELSEGVYFWGERLDYKQVPNPEAGKSQDAPETATEYTLHEGSLTTNDLPVPFYEVQYDRMVVMPGRRVWTYNMVLMAQGWPMFYLPFYTRTLDRSDIAYYFYGAHDSDLGFIVYNRLNVELTPEYRFDFYGDYYTEAGIGKGAKLRYGVPGGYGPKGEIYGYHIEQEAPDNDRINDGKDRYNFQGTYEQDLPWDMRVSGRGHYISDSEYLYDYRSSELYREIDVHRLEREDVSHLSISKYWDEQTLRVTGAAHLDKFYYSGLPYVERKPQARFEQYPVNLFGTDLFAELSLDYGRYRREQGVTFPLDERNLFNLTNYVDEVDRYDADFKLSYPVKLPERFTVTPWAGYRGTHYDDASRRVDPSFRVDPANQFGFSEFNFGSETRHMLQAGADISRRSAYLHDSFLGRYETMRTVIEPVLSYGYYDPDTALEERTAGPGVRFPYIDPVDDYRYAMHHAGAVVRTRVQGKDAGGIINDFMRLNAGFAFDYLPDDNLVYDNFEFFDDTANETDRRFSDLVEDFAIFPWEWLSFGNSLRFDIDDGVVRSSLYYTTVQPWDPLKLTVGYNTYRYPFINADEQQDATIGLAYKLSNKWNVYYNGRFDIDEGLFRRNDIGLLRDMYDFFTLITLEHNSHPTLGDDLSISFRVGFWGIGPRKPARQAEMLNPAALFF